MDNFRDLNKNYNSICWIIGYIDVWLLAQVLKLPKPCAGEENEASDLLE
jgi:hypothetical protein